MISAFFFCFPVRCADVLRFGLGFCGSARPAGCLTASLRRARLDHRIGMGTVRWATVEGCGPPRSEAPGSHEFRESPAAPSQSELSRCGTQLVGCVRAHPRLAAGSTSNYGHTLPVLLNRRIPISNIFSLIFCVYFSPGGSVYVTAQLTMALPVLPQLSTSFLPSSAPPSQRLVEDLSRAFFFRCWASQHPLCSRALSPAEIRCRGAESAPGRPRSRAGRGELGASWPLSARLRCRMPGSIARAGLGLSGVASGRSSGSECHLSKLRFSSRFLQFSNHMKKKTCSNGIQSAP